MPKDLPEKVSLRGLSAADLVVLLAYHGEKSRRPCFYRDQVWLLWYEELGTPEAVLERWTRLSKKARAWIAPGHFSVGLASVARGIGVAKRERGPDWVLRPDAHPNKLFMPVERERQILQLLKDGISQTEISRRTGSGRSTVCSIARGKSGTNRRQWGTWFQKRLWLSWWEAFGAPTYRNPAAIAERWAGLPDQVQQVIEAGTKPTGYRRVRKPTRRHVSEAVEYARRKRDGTSPAGSGGSAKSRRRKWLGLLESGWTIPEIRDWWQGLCGVERREIGGPRAYQKLRGSKGTMYRRIQTEIHIGRWEREIEGKPPRYGLGLYLLREVRRGGAKTSAEAANRWDRLHEVTRDRYCPAYPGKLPPSGKARRRCIHSAISELLT